MNINNQLFEAITCNLNTVLDTFPDHPKTETKEYAYYAMDCCMSVLMSYYQCPDQSKKEPKKLLSSVFDCGVMIRALCDSEKDFEKRNTLAYCFLLLFRKLQIGLFVELRLLLNIIILF